MVTKSTLLSAHIQLVHSVSTVSSVSQSVDSNEETELTPAMMNLHLQGQQQPRSFGCSECRIHIFRILGNLVVVNGRTVRWEKEGLLAEPKRDKVECVLSKMKE